MTPKPTHPPPPRRSASKRPKPRQEATGPMKFGLSPQGIFITREDVHRLLTNLLQENPDIMNEGTNALRELVMTLRLVSVDGTSSEPPRPVQVMKSFFECVRG